MFTRRREEKEEGGGAGGGGVGGAGRRGGIIFFFFRFGWNWTNGRLYVRGAKCGVRNARLDLTYASKVIGG